MVVNAKELKDSLGEVSIAKLERKIDGFLIENRHKNRIEIELEQKDLPGLSSKDIFTLMNKYAIEGNWKVRLWYDAYSHTKQEDITTWSNPYLEFKYK